MKMPKLCFKLSNISPPRFVANSAELFKKLNCRWRCCRKAAGSSFVSSCPSCPSRCETVGHDWPSGRWKVVGMEERRVICEVRAHKKVLNHFFFLEEFRSSFLQPRMRWRGQSKRRWRGSRRPSSARQCWRRRDCPGWGCCFCLTLFASHAMPFLPYSPKIKSTKYSPWPDN